MSIRSVGKTPSARISRALALWIATALSTMAQTLDHFDFSAITSPKYAYAPLRIIVTARSSTGAIVRTYTGTPVLTAISGGTTVSVEALSELMFTSGQWVGNVVVTEPASDVMLRVTGSGRSGTSVAFEVLPTTFRVLNLPVISLVSDLARGVLYASVGPTNAPFGTIHVIDPASGNIINSHFIAGGVERLEMTDDASKLYVVSEDQLKVRRLRLPDFVEEVALTLGESEPGYPNYARDVAAHPSRPNVVAVVKGRRHVSPWFTGLSVFEDTVEKSTPSVFVAEANVVHWGDKPNRLYGHNNQSSPNDFIQYDLTETNLTIVASRRNLLSLFNGDIDYIDGKLYCSTGRIIDPESLALLAELANGHSDAVMLALPQRKRIIYFTPNTLGQMLTYDSETLQLLNTEPWPMPRPYVSGAAFWGSNGIAFHDGKRLYLTENVLIPTTEAPADLQVTANATQPVVDVGANHEMTAFVKNLGPNAASSVLIRVSGVVDTVLSAASAVGKNSTTTVLNRSVSLELDSLAVGEEVEVRFTARSDVAAWQPFSIIATSSAIDPNGKNNSACVVLKAQPLPGLDTHVVMRVGTTAMVADQTRGTLIIAPSAAAAPAGNSVMAVNPKTGEISQPVWVGSRPSELAISDDGKFLFVGFFGLSEVRRYSLPGMDLDLTIPLGADGWSGVWFATDIAVRPGHPSEIAVARSTVSALSTNPETDRMGYFHNATDLLADRSEPEAVRFASADRLLAFEESWGIFSFDVTDSSITWHSILRDIFAGSPPSFAYDNGKMFFNAGAVHDAETGARLGTFDFFGPYGPGPIVDGASGRALVVSRGLNQQVISAFDVNTYSRIDTNLVNGSFGTFNDFERWSADGLALSGSTGVAIFKTHLLPSAPQELRVAVVSMTGGSVAIQFSNLSPGQYVIEECSDLGGAWSQVGTPFTEGTAELRVTSAEARKFYRLVKLQ